MGVLQQGYWCGVVEEISELNRVSVSSNRVLSLRGFHI